MVSNPLENRFLRLAVIVPASLWMVVVVSLVNSAPGRAKAPACVEYCYEPIPVPGTDSGPAPTQESSQTAAGLEVNDVRSPAERALGVVSREPTDPRKQTTGNEVRGDRAFVVGRPSAESTEGASGAWIALLVVLALSTVLLALVGFVRLRRGGGLSRGDLLVRGLALFVGLGLVFLLSPGVSGASAASAPRSFFGMMSIENITQTDADRMASGGVSTYRFPMSWDSVQPNSSSSLEWGLMDASIAATARAGMRALPILSATPKGFAANWTEMPIYSRAQKQGWANFLRSAIDRYGPGGDFWSENPDIPKYPIRTWQIWNEANFFYFTNPVVPADYLKLLKASHKVVKAEDPGAKVMLSGLFGSPPNMPRKAMKSWQFLDKLYKMGAKPYFDSVAIHPYSPDTTQLRLIIEKIRSTMNRNGAKKTPIDVTEIGWGSDSRTVFGKGSLQGQAQQLTSGFDYLIRNRKKMGIRSAYWFAWKDLPTTFESCNQCYFSGLFKSGPTLKPKPSWDAFVALTGGSRN